MYSSSFDIYYKLIRIFFVLISIPAKVVVLSFAVFISLGSLHVYMIVEVVLFAF
jgi:hypothetical protein